MQEMLLQSELRAPARTTVASRARIAAAAVALGSAVFLLLGESTALAQRSAFTPHALTEAPRTGWPTNGGNLYNQRYSPLTRIDRANVGSLKGVWRTHLNGSGAAPQFSGEAQPIVHEGVIYVITGADDVFALSIETGEILWQHLANLDPALTSVCCGWTSRGVGIGDGKIFAGMLDGRLTALDQRTGREVWSIQAESWQEGFSITSAPLYYDGMVITGFSGAEIGVRGRVKAYDADDGKLLWTFYTIPGPGEVGHDTWPQDNEVWMHGGATVWQTPAVDAELGLLYFSTGNPGPDFNGSVRAGDNLFSASIVAIEARTGRYRWHFQEVHHDIWDYDAPNPVVLFDAPIDGRMRKGLAQVGKTGWAYILDRETGAPLIGIDERPVPQEPRQATAATQPYPRGDAIVPQHVDIAPEGYELVNQGRIFTPYVGDKGMIVSPSLYGGANWPPSSYDPVRHFLFVCASDVAGNFIGGDRDFEIPPDGQRYEGGVVGFAPLPRTGIFAAVDVTTNKLAWRYRWPDQCYSGSLATSGGLVFVGRNDGRLTALDSDTGLKLWEFQTGAGMNAPASTFEHEGKQYVVALSAGNVLIGSAKGDSVWLFGLDGTLPPTVERDTQIRTTAVPAAPAAPAPSEAPAAPGSDAAPAALAAAGEDVFKTACVACHGEDGMGGHGGGAALDQVKDPAMVMATVVDGRGNMPPLGSMLTQDQIRAVAAYVTNGLFK
jgi:quinohemoprotein ethanol dehydrogenase